MTTGRRSAFTIILPRFSIKWADAKRMLVTTRVTQETMRVASILSFSFREAVVDVEYEGYLIPIGWKVMPLFRNIHPTHWSSPLVSTIQNHCKLMLVLPLECLSPLVAIHAQGNGTHSVHRYRFIHWYQFKAKQLHAFLRMTYSCPIHPLVPIQSQTASCLLGMTHSCPGNELAKRV